MRVLRNEAVGGSIDRRFERGESFRSALGSGQ
jgi:hypothetical protein